MQDGYKELKHQHFNLGCFMLSLRTMNIWFLPCYSSNSSMVSTSLPLSGLCHYLYEKTSATRRWLRRIKKSLPFACFIYIFLGSCIITQPLCHHHNIYMALKKILLDDYKGPKCDSFLFYFIVTNSLVCQVHMNRRCQHVHVHSIKLLSKSKL